MVFFSWLAAITLINGAGQYGSETLEAVQGSGLVKLKGTIITNDLVLSGSLISQNASVGSLEILGSANLTETTIHNGGKVDGSIQTVRSKILKPLSILTQKAIFTASQLDSLTVRQDPSFKGKQIIELRQKTIVNGSIHFDSGKGEVILFPGCYVVGEVTGGKVIKKN